MINKPLLVRLPEELRQAAQVQADKHGLSLSSYVRMLIAKEIYKPPK